MRHVLDNAITGPAQKEGLGGGGRFSPPPRLFYSEKNIYIVFQAGFDSESIGLVLNVQYTYTVKNITII